MEVSKLGLYRGYKPVIVPTNTGRITMKGITKPVIAINQHTGEYLDTMVPNKEYKFPTDLVLEVPIMQDGGLAEYKNLMNYQDGGSPSAIRNQMIRDLFKESIYSEDDDTQPAVAPVQESDVEETTNYELEKIKNDNIRLQEQLDEMQDEMFGNPFSNKKSYNSKKDFKNGMFAKVTTYGYNDDPYSDNNSKNAIGHNNNKLVEGTSVALSQKTANAYGFKRGDFINVKFGDGKQQKVRYDDTIPSNYDNENIPRIDFFTPSKQYQKVDGQSVQLSKFQSGGTYSVSEAELRALKEANKRFRIV